MLNPRLHSLLDSEDKLLRFKSSLLKQKTILHEDPYLQIGLKASLIYDFYSSRYFLLLLLFFGNKADQPIHNFSLDFRGDPNLQFYVQQRPRSIREHSQHKERLVVGLPAQDSQPWLTLSFSSNWSQVSSLPVPLGLIRFMHFSPMPVAQSPVSDYEPLQNLFKYTEQSEVFPLNKRLLKQGGCELQKQWAGLRKVSDRLYLGTFELGTQGAKHLLVVQIRREQAKIEISSNDEKYLQPLLQNVQFILGN